MNNKTGQQQSNTTNSKEIWNRVGHVELTIFSDTDAQTYDFDGLDFKFSISTILGRIPEGNMSVSICGLSQDTANQIVTLCNVFQALQKRKTLKLYAGYADPENKNYRGDLIAVMDVINATITTPPPDIWLQITAVYAGWLNDQNFTIEVTNLSMGEKSFVAGQSTTGYTQTVENAPVPRAQYVSLEDSLKEICKGLNELNKKLERKVTYSYDVSRVKYKGFVPGKTRRFSFNGSLAQIPTKVSEYYKVHAMWEERDDNAVCLAVYPDPQHVVGLSPKEKKYVQGATIKFLDVDHGLIGIPKLKDSIKLECRCFLDGKLKAGDYVSVRSEMLPVIYEYGQAINPSNKTLAKNWGGEDWDKDENGNVTPESKDTIKAYQIMKIKFTGHLRGNEWYCDIEARRPDMISERVDENIKPRPIRLVETIPEKWRGWRINEETGELLRPLN